MTDINLIPWRSLEREQRRQDFYILIGLSVVLAILIAIFLNFFALSFVDHQKNRNRQLQDEIVLLDAQIRKINGLKALKDNLIARMKIIQRLQANRILTVHLFDEIIKVLPDGVYLTDIKKAGDVITLMGYSESNTNVSLLMRNIQQNPWIQVPNLTEIKKNKNTAGAVNNEFNLRFILKPKK